MIILTLSNIGHRAKLFDSEEFVEFPNEAEFVAFDSKTMAPFDLQ